jgi:hypothetical protein
MKTADLWPLFVSELWGVLPMPTNVTDLHLQEARSPSRFSTEINNPVLIAAVLLCTVGVMIIRVAAVRFPDLGAIIAQSNQF